MLFSVMDENQRRILENTYMYLLSGMFPYKYETCFDDAETAEIGKTLTEIRTYYSGLDFSPVSSFEMPDEQVVSGCRSAEEYRRFMEFWNEKYVSEMMLIGKHITPFNTLGHVCGVHNVAMHIAGQLAETGFPVDTALVSAVAMAHDLGKYGCTGDELKRVPYLHYYYTDELLRRNGMPQIARIAGNHSVWDLERNSLSAEWLILIYSDFRVKSVRDADGSENVIFSSLEDAFKVILEKLDNVDEAKRERYKRAYGRLKKFEEYMVYLGVDPDLNGSLKSVPHSPQEAAPFMMLDYQLRIASKFNYLSQEMIEEMLQSMADSFAERSESGRKQTVMIMEELLSNYDRVNNKELPQGVTLPSPERTAAELREKYREILRNG